MPAFHSVANGIAALSDACDLIAVQDGVRPLATHEAIRRIARTAEREGSAIPVVQPVDSFRIVTAEGASHPVERATLRIVQTPQFFRAELLRKLLPKPLVMPVCKELDIQSKTYVKKIGDKEIDRLISLLKGFVLPISDYAPFEYAVVTAGGVRCDEVNHYTMESLKVKGLYFAGEVLDLDANTGGYNLQIAFSTGRLAGQLKQ